MDQEGKNPDKEEILGSGQSMRGYILTYSYDWCFHTYLINLSPISKAFGETKNTRFYLKTTWPKIKSKHG